MWPTVLERAWSWFISPPADRITDADRRTVHVVGLELPVRASVAVAVATIVLLIDLSRVLVPEAAAQLGRAPDGVRAMALERLVLFGVVPLLVVLLAFRDHPARYGWTFGDGRAGAALALVGCLVMTPIVLWFAGLPDVRAFYAVSAGPPADVVLTNALELIAAEFLFRGFLMFTLVRSDRPDRRPHRGHAVRVRPRRQARPRAALDARRRARVWLAGMAHAIDPVGSDRPRLHPQPRDPRRRTVTRYVPLRRERRRRRPSA